MQMNAADGTPADGDAASVQAFAARLGRGPRRSRAFALKAAASVALIVLVLRGADLGAVRDALLDVRLEWVAVAIVLQIIGPALIARRWQGLLAARGVTPGWPYLYRSTLVSTFFRQFLPSIVGGDVIRGYDAWRAGAGVGLAFTSLLVDRLLGLLALALFAVGALAFSGDLVARIPGIWLWVGAGLGAIAAMLWGLVAPPGWMRRAAAIGLVLAPAGLAARLRGIGAALAHYNNARATLLRAFALSVLLQANVVTFYWALSMALDLHIDYQDFYIIAPLAIFVMMIPLSINGIGIREGVFIFLLGLWQVDSNSALAFSWLEYGIFLFFGIIGGMIHAFRRGYQRTDV